MKSNNIIGPINPVDWNFMLMLRKSIGMMKNRKDMQYEEAIRRENDMYQDTLKSYLPNKAA